MSFQYSTPPESVVDFSADFEFLYHYKQYMLSDMMIGIGNTSHELDVKTCLFEDNRKFRRAYPHGKEMIREYLQEVKEKEKNDEGKQVAYFVGFFGKMKEFVSQDTEKQVWEIDNLMIQELANHPHMLFYGTCQLRPEGDYFNLVLFRSNEAVNQWRLAKGHDRAIG